MSFSSDKLRRLKPTSSATCFIQFSFSVRSTSTFSSSFSVLALSPSVRPTSGQTGSGYFDRVLGFRVDTTDPLVSNYLSVPSSEGGGVSLLKVSGP